MTKINFLSFFPLLEVASRKFRMTHVAHIITLLVIPSAHRGVSLLDAWDGVPCCKRRQTLHLPVGGHGQLALFPPPRGLSTRFPSQLSFNSRKVLGPHARALTHGTSRLLRGAPTSGNSLRALDPSSPWPRPTTVYLLLLLWA